MGKGCALGGPKVIILNSGERSKWKERVWVPPEGMRNFEAAMGGLGSGDGVGISSYSSGSRGGRRFSLRHFGGKS